MTHEGADHVPYPEGVATTASADSRPASQPTDAPQRAHTPVSLNGQTAPPHQTPGREEEEAASKAAAPLSVAADAGVAAPPADDGAGEPMERPTRIRGYRNPEAEQFLTYDFDAAEEMIERQDADRLTKGFGGLGGLEKALRTSVARGIDPATAEQRTAQFGENVLSVKEPSTFLPFLWEAFQDKVIIILCVAAVISIVFGMTLKNPYSGHVERSTGWIEGTAIIISVAIVTLTGSINNYIKAKQFEEMEREQSIKQLTVLRDGHRFTVPSNTLCVGDVLVIETGMEMSCDCVIIHNQEIAVNESALTGEPLIMSKDEATVDSAGPGNPFLISGTQVEEGNGIALVLAVGMGSYQGTLKKSLDEESEDTPLQEHLDNLANKIAIFAFVGALLLIIALSVKEGIRIGLNKTEASAASFLNFILIAVTLVAVAIPEGLPLAVTIALAFAMRAMMGEQCMVRVLMSCETMGAATAICSDKTGTLTTNQMTVVQGCVAEAEFVLAEYGIVPRTVDVAELPRSSPLPTTVPEAARELFCRAVVLNSTATEADVAGQMEWVGNKTEQGMLKWIKATGFDYRAVRAACPHERTKQYPFSSMKKRMTTVVLREDLSGCDLFTKGASETILGASTSYTTATGAVAPLTPEVRAKFEAIITNMADQGNRTIGVAYADNLPAELPTDEPESAELVFAGIFGIQDPIRPEVPDAVRGSNGAGLIVRMVTGDNIHTAIAIGKKCGLYQDNGFDLAWSGQDFARRLAMGAEEVDKIKADLPRLKILARSSPNDKLELVKLLQENGEVVGVTGDGTNDAPALKKANVGFAMNTGTDIAKGAADMVLLDDNFATVVTATRWGRAVNDNIKKFLQFQLAINVGGVALTAIGALASQTSKEPFTPVQLLWLNLIMDTLAALSLATEMPENASLCRRPVFLQAPFITRKMIGFVGIHGLFQFTVIILIMFFGHKWFHTVDDSKTCDFTFKDGDAAMAYCKKICKSEGGVWHNPTCQQGKVHSTIIFNTYIWFQVVNVINARKIYGEVNPFEGVWTRSKQLILIFFIIAALQTIAVFVGGKAMSTTRISGKHWGICLGIAASEFIVGAIQRALPIKDIVPEEIQKKDEYEAGLRAKYTNNRAAAPQ